MRDRSPAEGLAVAMFRILVLALPRPLRQSYGTEMCAMFENGLEDARRESGTLAVPLCCAKEIAAMAVTACRARLTGVPVGAAGRGLYKRLVSASVEAGGSRASPCPSHHLPALAGADDRPYKVAWVCALSFHFLLFVVPFPEAGSDLGAQPKDDVIVVRIYKPPPPPKDQPDRKRVIHKANPVPIPDLNPHDPEPIVVEEIIYQPLFDPPETDFSVSRPVSPLRHQGPLRAGVDVEPPKLLHSVRPEYPEIARRARYECSVALQATINERGELAGASVLRACGLGLDEAAIEAVSRWRYTPTFVDGRPVAITLTVKVIFELR